MTRSEALQALQAALQQVPAGFLDDGCSAAPDRLFMANLRPACRAHDWLYCTRAHPAGRLTQAHRHGADRLLGLWVRALLPFGVGWLGWLYWRATHRWGGVEAFDSCEWEAGATCRHGLTRPPWMEPSN